MLLAFSAVVLKDQSSLHKTRSIVEKLFLGCGEIIFRMLGTNFIQINSIQTCTAFSEDCSSDPGSSDFKKLHY